MIEEHFQLLLYLGHIEAFRRTFNLSVEFFGLQIQILLGRLPIVFIWFHTLVLMMRDGGMTLQTSIKKIRNSLLNILEAQMLKLQKVNHLLV